MRYKQICPECYSEVIINSLDEAVEECPECYSRSIANQKIIAIETIDEQQSENVFEEVAVTEADNESEKISSWDDILESYGLAINQIELKYVSGIIDSEFSIKLSSEKNSYILGRSEIGKEYFEKDLHIGNEHCYIIYDEGKWKIKDNNSRNGTMLNGQLLIPQKEEILKKGDIIQFGKLSTAVRLEVKM